MYGTIMILTAVYHEIVVRGCGQPGSAEVQVAPWISVQRVESTEAIVQMNLRLNPGEAEAITLAKEQQADLLLIDERQGRQVAATLQLPFTGVLGVLLAAKQHGMVTVVRPLLDALQRRAGFWISEQMYTLVIQMSREDMET
jgi:hypothetical protein